VLTYQLPKKLKTPKATDKKPHHAKRTSENKMFDIGFPELVVLSIVALLVIGPKKLPETIRTLSIWIARIQRSLANIRREIESEVGADEFRQQLHNESVMKELEDTKNTLQQAGQDVRATINATVEQAETLVPADNPKSRANDDD
jgi:sec-independent protein translocase protein TatB